MSDNCFIVLRVDDVVIPEESRHRYTVRFVGASAVLYLDGKRVTKAWRLQLIADVEADERGQSTNTA